MSKGGPAGTAAGQRRNPRTENTLLGARGDLPPRVRGALETLLEHACNWFEPAMRRALDQLENTLFGMAERAGTSGVQQRHFEFMREIKLARADVIPRFLQHVESMLAAVRASEAVAQDPQEQSTFASLGLVDNSAFEEDLALQEIASKAEVRNSMELHALAQRLAVIAGTPVYSNETLPLGPAQVCAALRFAVGNIDLDTEHRVLLYRHFDRAAVATIGAFYEAANAKLVTLRILPHLAPSSFRRAPGARKDGEAPTAAETAPDKPVEEAPAPAPAPPASAGAGGAPARRADAPQRAPAPAGMPPAPGPAQAAPGGPAAADDPKLFGMLRDLLGRASPPPAKPSTPSAAPQWASGEDLQNVLGAMQRSVTTSGARMPQWDAEHFRNTLLVKLRRRGNGQAMTLGGEDADTVELVGMLFDYIMRETAGGDSLRALLTRLHVPVLRVALSDKTFFARRDHPARELLNTIAETGSRWMGDSEADNGLLDRIRMVVEHVGSNFDGELGVFENLLQDLTTYMRQLARRADVVERRNVDAAKGRDKLEVARRTARGAVVHALEGNDPPQRVRTLLEHAWVDALTLSLLRDGEEGAEFRRRVTVASHLARSGEPVRGNDAVDASLRRELEGGLRQVGLHADDVDGVLKHLYGENDAGDSPEAEAEQEKQIARVYETIREKTRLGEAEETRAAPQADPQRPLTEPEQAALEQIKRTAFGTWFDFVVNQQGETTRRKLAWYSPTTGHCLFVNQRGARVDDHRSLDQLARDMARGQVRVAAAEQASLIDRAWRAIVDSLKRRAPATPAGASA